MLTTVVTMQPVSLIFGSRFKVEIGGFVGEYVMLKMNASGTGDLIVTYRVFCLVESGTRLHNFIQLTTFQA